MCIVLSAGCWVLSAARFMLRVSGVKKFKKVQCLRRLKGLKSLKSSMPAAFKGFEEFQVVSVLRVSLLRVSGLEKFKRFNACGVWRVWRVSDCFRAVRFRLLVSEFQKVIKLQIRKSYIVNRKFFLCVLSMCPMCLCGSKKSKCFRGHNASRLSVFAVNLLFRNPCQLSPSGKPNPQSAI